MENTTYESYEETDVVLEVSFASDKMLKMLCSEIQGRKHLCVNMCCPCEKN